MSLHTIYFPDGDVFGPIFEECDYKSKINIMTIEKSLVTKSAYSCNWREQNIEGQTLLLWLQRKQLLPIVAVYLSKNKIPVANINYIKFKKLLLEESKKVTHYTRKSTVLTFEDCNKCGDFIITDSFTFVDAQENSIEILSHDDFVVTCNNTECRNC